MTCSALSIFNPVYCPKLAFFPLSLALNGLLLGYPGSLGEAIAVARSAVSSDADPAYLARSGWPNESREKKPL